MLLKTFHAKEMAEALRQVKAELGPDAVILGSRQVVKKGFFGLVSRTLYEVTATAELPRKRSYQEHQAERESSTRDELQSALLAPLMREMRELREQVAAMKKERLGEQSPVVARFEPPQPQTQAKGSSLEKEEMDELKKILLQPQGKRVTERAAVMQPSAPLSNPASARGLEKAAQPATEEIGCGAPIRLKKGGTKVVALVGPSGVGKTATVAKLAAQFALKKGSAVAVVAIDNHRIGGIEQLRTYARILDVPMAVAATREELESILYDCDDRDLVIIDTPGINPLDAEQITELKELLHGLPVETYLCLSAASSVSVLTKAHDNFSQLSGTRLILTKIDEAGSLAEVAPFIAAAGVAVSYLATGQKVPDDLETVTEKRLAALMGHQQREERPLPAKEPDRIVRWEPPRTGSSSVGARQVFRSTFN